MGFLFALSGGFATGVLLRSLFSLGWAPVLFAFLIATLCLGAWIATPRTVYALAALFCIFAALGMLRTAATDMPLPQSFASELHHRVTYTGTVVADPDLRDTSQRVPVRVTQNGVSTTLLVVARRYPSVSVGDTVRVTGELLKPQPFVGDNGRVFRYDRYLARDGISFLLDYAYVRIVTPAPWYSLPAALARAKHAFLDGLNAVLPEPYSSLAGGVVIGGKTGLGTDLQQAFTRSGLVQIIVLSGYNVMIVAEWMMAALARVSLARRWNAGAGALAVLLFVGVAGLSATALRAMLMAFIALYARATGKSYAASRALLLAVFLMLLWNPLYLAFDPGFDLSVAATAGLIWLAPLIEKRLLFVKHLFWRDVTATTLAAQVSVLPLLLYETGNLSWVAIPANILVAPVVPLTMALSAIAGVSGMLFGSLAPLLGMALGYPAYLANAFLIQVATTAASLPGAAVTISLFPWWLMAVLYAALAFIASSKRFSTTPQLRLLKKAET